MNWDQKAAEGYACFELSSPPLKSTVVARHNLANWIVFGEPLRTEDALPLAPAKPVAWGECHDPVQARADAEAAMSIIRFCQTTGPRLQAQALWPESTTGIIHHGGGIDRFLVPCAIAAQRALQAWGLRPYYEGNGGTGQLVLIAAEWTPSDWPSGQGEENAIVWTGFVRDPLAANEMTLALSELFSHIRQDAANCRTGLVEKAALVGLRAATMRRFSDRQCTVPCESGSGRTNH